MPRFANVQQVRIVILGNSGSGKTTLAKALAAQHHVPVLAMDDIAWQQELVRAPLEASIRAMDSFMEAHRGWIIEGCYGDLAEHALKQADELVFLNPGVQVCVERCRKRPWEPEKYPTPEAQDAMLRPLIAWVQHYETRDDEFGLMRHRRIYDAFPGRKREVTRSED